VVWGVVILLVCLVLGLPIYVALLSSGLYLLVIVKGIPIDIIIIGLYGGVAKFTLLAVPFFLLAGAFMQNSSISRRLVDCTVPWLVNVRGGIPMASIFANELFGAISGSAPAAAATIGRVMFPVVSKVTGEKYALGLFTSAGALAIVMPPSINMILFATATGASTGALFLAGIIPAMIIGLFYAAYIYISSPAPDQKEVFSLKYAFRKTLEGVPVLMFPVLILGGIYLGVFTPTEAGAVSAVYAFALPFLFWREMGVREIVESIKNSVKLTAQIFILIAASVVFSQALTMSHVPEILRQSLGSLGPFWFMVFLNIILLFVGCFFDPSSAVLVLGPVMAPIAEALGIDLLHLGVVFAVNLAIGMFTPPFGLNLFIIQSIFNRPLDQIARSVPRFFVVFLLALIIITYFPQVYMWLPKLWLAQ